MARYEGRAREAPDLLRRYGGADLAQPVAVHVLNDSAPVLVDVDVAKGTLAHLAHAGVRQLRASDAHVHERRALAIRYVQLVKWCTELGFALSYPGEAVRPALVQAGDVEAMSLLVHLAPPDASGDDTAGPVARWRTVHEATALQYRGGRGWLRIEDCRASVWKGETRPPRAILLRDTGAAVYRACDAVRGRDELAACFPTVARGVLDRFVATLIERGLLLDDGYHLLALAFRVHCAPVHTPTEVPTALATTSTAELARVRARGWRMTLRPPRPRPARRLALLDQPANDESSRPRGCA